MNRLRSLLVTGGLCSTEKRMHPMRKDKADQRGMVRMEDPFEGIPVPERMKIIRQVGVKAKETSAQLKEDIDSQLKRLEPIDCICTAGFLLVFTGDKATKGGEYSFGQHQAELLQALLMRHPQEFYEGLVGAPEQIEAALDLAKGLTDASLKIPYADIPEDEEEFHRRSVMEAMRLHTQVMRGEYYPEQWTRLYRPSLERISARFSAVYGIAPTAIYDVAQRLMLSIEDRLNEHVQRCAAFYKERTLGKIARAYRKSFPDTEEVDIEELRKLFGGGKDEEIIDQVKMMMVAHANLKLRGVFTITEKEFGEVLASVDAKSSLEAAKAVFDKISLSFGDVAEKPIDHVIMDNPVWSRPMIKVGDEWVFPLPTTFSSYCSTIFFRLAESDAQLKQVYEDERAAWLERTTEALIKEALPGATVWRSVKWVDPVTNKKFENDTVVLIDRWLLLFEAKSGQVTDSARRGSYERLKKEIEKLMVEPSMQSSRLAQHLRTNPQVHEFDCWGGKCKIDSKSLDGIIRVNVTNESIGDLNSRGGNLIKAGLVPKGTDLAPTMSLSSLDLVLQFLGSQSAIIHYLYRRKPFEENASYMADELDLVVFYLDNGFNIGDTETDDTLLVIYGFSNEFDLKLARSRDRKLGNQSAPAITAYWERFLNRLEQEGRDGWLKLAMRLRGVSADDQKTLEKAIRRAIYKAKKKGPLLVQLMYGPKARREGLMALVRGGKFEPNELAAEVQESYRQMSKAGVKAPLFLLFVPPLAAVLKDISVVQNEDECVEAAER